MIATENPPTGISYRGGNLTGMAASSTRIKAALDWVQAKVSQEMAIAMNASIWMVNVDTFRELVESDPPANADDLMEHRFVLSALITDGEKLVVFAKKLKMDRMPPGFSVADMEATVESLHVEFNCQHRSNNNPPTKAAVEALFDA